MLRATRRELTRAFRLHRQYCHNLEITTFKLIGLYCIECGVKALILSTSRLESTDELSPEKQIGHDLVAGLMLLRAPAELYRLNRLSIDTRHIRDPQQHVAAKDLHQALRYGIPTTLQVETAVEMEHILDWLEEQLNGI